MTTANLPTAATETAPPVDGGPAPTEGEVREGPACQACAHPLGAHDEIGLRFCAATTSAALSRGCICR
ncbi:RGCVC family protein [Rhodococcus antarcticus]|uniref:RGCVC family protein n=1 Tax=Rhodococcus antarcticus TaxID=2987751 RepID=UPI00338D6EAA